MPLIYYSYYTFLSHFNYSSQIFLFFWSIFIIITTPLFNFSAIKQSSLSMGMFHGRRRPSIASLFTAMLVLLFASATHSFSSTRKLGNGMRNERQDARGSTTTAVAILESIMMSRRRLSGPGSSPPSCRSKCGRCAPCSPVHVPVHPGLTIPLEYYPEAWRCKCGNKLYMP